MQPFRQVFDDKITIIINNSDTNTYISVIRIKNYHTLKLHKKYLFKKVNNIYLKKFKFECLLKYLLNHHQQKV